jgi:polyhydroxyalkanoate synthase
MSATETVIDPVDPPVLGANPFVGLTRQQVAAALGRLLQRMAVEPGVVLADGLEATGELVKVMIGRSHMEPAAGDKRFTHTAWSSNPVYRRLVQAYLVQTRAMLGVVDDVELDAKSRERARFALSLFIEAVAPTNTLPGNPAAMGKAIQTRGCSLVSGTRHFLHDARHNNRMPSTVDRRPFSVGANVAVTPGQVVHRAEVFELIQYAPSTDTTRTRSLVAIPPQINKFYIEDIAPGWSLIEHTVAAGIPYFAISWRNPTAEQRDWNLDTYVAACKEAVDVACHVTGSPDANTLGICAGGITMACLLGHLAAAGEPLVNAATFMVAGLDTSVESMIGMLASTAAVEAARTRRSAPACSTARTWRRCSPGSGRTTSCGTTG